jgi:hypothetical protein
LGLAFDHSRERQPGLCFRALAGEVVPSEWGQREGSGRNRNPNRPSKTAINLP